MANLTNHSINMKKLLILFVIVASFSACTNCDDENEDDKIAKQSAQVHTSNNENSDKKESNSAKQTNNKEDILANYSGDLDSNSSILHYLMDPAFYYAEVKKMQVMSFDEREILESQITLSDFDKALDEAVPVKIETVTDDNGREKYTYYHLTATDSDYYYYGSLDENNNPTGIGYIFDDMRVYSDMGNKGTSNNKAYNLRYIGNFDNGYYSGYGIEFYVNTPMVDDMDLRNSDYYTWLLYYNASEFKEAYWSYGHEAQKVNDFTSAIVGFGLIENWPYKENEIPKPSDLAYSLTAKKMNEDSTVDYYQYILGFPYFEGCLTSDGKMTGYCKKYTYTDTSIGILQLEGNFVDGCLNGEGKEYFEDTGSLKYEGNFVDGKYDGKGILYDENGKVIYEGIFVNGEVQ